MNPNVRIEPWSDGDVELLRRANAPAGEAVYRGIAAAATAAAIELARAEGRHRFLHAFPPVGNAASNALCGKAGFELAGPCDFEFPPGNIMRCNDWRLDLTA